MDKIDEISDEIWQYSTVAYYAIKDGKCDGIQRVLDEYPFFVAERDLMLLAAKHNNVAAMRMFLDAGYPPDFRGKESPLVVPLSRAADYCAIDVARLLLDAGANVNENNNGRSATPMVSASREGDMEMVKLLVSRGADIHAEYTVFGGQYNALKWAVQEGHHELANYLRSLGVQWPKDPPKGDEISPHEERLKYLSKYFRTKSSGLGFDEIVPASVPMSVCTFPPMKRKRRTTVFVSSGLSDYTLNVSAEQSGFTFAEYFMEMPGDWKITTETMGDDSVFWPVSWVKLIGRYPHEQEISYGEERILTQREIPSLQEPSGRYVAARVRIVPDLHLVISEDGRYTVFYRIEPLTQEELDAIPSDAETDHDK